MIAALKRFIIGLLGATCRKRTNAVSFLVPAYTGLGNFLMMSPMIRTLRALYPSARIHVLAGNRFGTEAVFRAGDGIVDAVHWLDEKLPVWKKALFFLRLRRERIATAFIPFDARRRSTGGAPCSPESPAGSVTRSRSSAWTWAGRATR